MWAQWDATAGKAGGKREKAAEEERAKEVCEAIMFVQFKG